MSQLDTVAIPYDFLKHSFASVSKLRTFHNEVVELLPNIEEGLKNLCTSELELVLEKTQQAPLSYSIRAFQPPVFGLSLEITQHNEEGLLLMDGVLLHAIVNSILKTNPYLPLNSGKFGNIEKSLGRRFGEVFIQPFAPKNELSMKVLRSSGEIKELISLPMHTTFIAIHFELSLGEDKGMLALLLPSAIFSNETFDQLIQEELSNNPPYFSRDEMLKLPYELDFLLGKTLLPAESAKSLQVDDILLFSEGLQLEARICSGSHRLPLFRWEPGVLKNRKAVRAKHY